MAPAPCHLPLPNYGLHPATFADICHSSPVTNHLPHINRQLPHISSHYSHVTRHLPNVPRYLHTVTFQLPPVNCQLTRVIWRVSLVTCWFELACPVLLSQCSLLPLLLVYLLHRRAQLLYLSKNMRYGYNCNPAHSLFLSPSPTVCADCYTFPMQWLVAKNNRMFDFSLKNKSFVICV